MPRASSRLLSLIVVAGLGCRSPADGGETLRASVHRDSLRLYNATERPVYFFAIEEWMMPLANWARCTDPSQCRAIEPHVVWSLSRDQLSLGGSDSVTVVVMWWHLVESGDGYREDGGGMTRAFFPRAGAAR